MLKLVTGLILVAVLVSMVGRKLFPRPPASTSRRVETARRCPECGAYRVEERPCETPGCAARGKG